MKKLILLSLCFLMCSVTMHVQSIGSCTIKETKGKLEYSFVFPKANISKIHKSLKDYNNSVKDIVVLQNILIDNIRISVNNEKVSLQYVTTITNQKFITIKYTTPIHEQITSIEIEDKGFSFFNDHHTSFDFWLFIQNKKRLFKLNAHHKIFKANY